MKRTSTILSSLLAVAACDANDPDGRLGDDVGESASEGTDETEGSMLDADDETDPDEFDTDGIDAEPIDPADPIFDPDDAQLGHAPAPTLAASTDPYLGWVLYSEPGTARLVRVDPATGVATTLRVWTFNTHWRPVGVAGNKLLWQRTDTGDVSLWTVNDTGGYVTHTFLSPPAGFIAGGITLDQDGHCPMVDTEDRTYTVLFQREASTWFTPAPQLWHLDATDAVTMTEALPVSYPWTHLRDFRYTADGYGALVYKNIFSFQGSGSDGTAIDWYGRDGAGNLERLRTDTYSATQGNVGCVAHQPGVQCFVDTNDAIPGAGHQLTSMVTTRNAGGNMLPASYLLWTRTDGTAKSYRLGLYSGKLLGPEAPIVTPHSGTSAVSFTSDAPEFCPIQIDPVDPPSFPSDPVLDPPGCINCG